MSRGWDENDSSAAYLWESTVQRCINGKRGQKLLHEFEAALLALPSKRLIADYLCKDGEFCAIGAFAQHKGVDITGYDGDDWVSMGRTAEIGEQAGLQWTLAWQIAFQNDNTWSRCTPEERYVQCLEWVREQIKKEPVNVH